jgi:hypothetical protein
LIVPIALPGQTGSLGADAVFNPNLVSTALDSSFGRALALRLGVPFLLWFLVGIAGVFLLAGILVSHPPPV